MFKIATGQTTTMINVGYNFGQEIFKWINGMGKIYHNKLHSELFLFFIARQWMIYFKIIFVIHMNLYFEVYGLKVELQSLVQK